MPACATPWLEHFFSTPAAADAMSDAAHLRAICLFEAALARAEGEAGVIPLAAAAVVAATVDAFARDLPVDPQALFADGAKAGTLAIPLVRQLTAAVRARDAAAAAYVHFGATSQDAIDTALVLQLAAVWRDLRTDITRCATACASLAERWARAPMLGRTLLQPATPITFGLKAAQWLTALVEARARLDSAAERALVLQFGGAAGSLGSLGDKGPAVARALARMLPGLYMAPTLLPWHTRRGALVSFCTETAIATGALGKIAQDIMLMMQLEVAEVFEPAEAGRGGSSAMPHKRNPVRTMQTSAAAQRTAGLAASLIAGMPQAHERAPGAWQAEWAVVPELFKLAAGAADRMADCLEGLVVDVAVMRRNLDALHGLPMTEAASLALAPHLGKAEAHRLIEEVSRRVAAGEGTLVDVLRSDARATLYLSAADFDRLADPSAALGATAAFIASALTFWHAQPDAPAGSTPSA